MQVSLYWLVLIKLQENVLLLMLPDLLLTIFGDSGASDGGTELGVAADAV